MSITLASLVTTGCFDRQELEQQAFVLAVGLDKAPGGLVDCSFQLALPISPSSGGGDSGGKKPLASKGPITIRAHTVMEAATLANAVVERRLTFTHLKMIAFGQTMAQQGLAEQVRPLTRYRDFRRTVMLLVCKGQAGDMLRQLNPVIEKSANRLPEDLLAVGQRSGFIPVEAHIHDFVRALSNPHESPVLPLCAVNQTAQQNSQGEEPLKGTTVSFAPGHLIRAGGNPVEWIGAAMFRKDQLVGMINGKQVMYLRLLRGTVTRATIDLTDPGHPGKQVTLSLHKERAPRVTVMLSNPVQVYARIPLDADLLGEESGANYADPSTRQVLEQRLGQQMATEEQQVLKQLYNQAKLDPIPLSKYIRTQFVTHGQFEQYAWESKLASMQFHTQFELHLRRFGIQTQPLVPVV